MDASDESYELINRLAALLDILQRGPAKARQLCESLERNKRAITQSDLRRTIRDIRALQHLGFQIEERSKPIIFTFRGYPQLAFNQRELYTLTLIREAFANLSPHADDVQHLLDRLTSSLSEHQRALYQRSPALRLPLRSAIDYRPYAQVIEQLERAIVQRQQIAFDYHPLAAPGVVRHERLDPYELEYLRNHFYLIAYSYRSNQVQEFRIDRIVASERSPEYLHTLAPPRRKRKSITFTYRLPARFVEHGVSERFEILDRQIKREQERDYAFIQARWWSDFWIIRTLLAYAENVVIIEPAWLKEKYVKTLREMLEANTENPAETKIGLLKSTSDT